MSASECLPPPIAYVLYNSVVYVLFFFIGAITVVFALLSLIYGSVKACIEWSKELSRVDPLGSPTEIGEA